MHEVTNLIEFKGRLINTCLAFPGSRQHRDVYPAVVWNVEQMRGKTQHEIAQESAVILSAWREAGSPT